ncbi:response regulator [Accumulibacter sp.]|uniref:response regulator n=1 Tax=Accumulibacter sp. TaxID=2053492 RepID=UPI0025F735B0|nr:response regulator [Accumulibacter sp.]MCM8594439.1 response regulator [Accumulibacter sp.]MCM8624925.1 response regulator [Accumulibacter sp.]MDS4048584.1 response regulator [Accumulibacter sp.]
MNDAVIRVAVVEDDSPIRSLVCEAVRRADFVPAEAETAGMGLELVADQDIRLVILDLGLPDMSGLDFIRELRTWSSIPILVLSARSGESDKIAALDAGADDYLTKPFSVGELLARLRVLLRRAPQEAISQVHRFADIEVDLVRHAVRSGGQDIHLTQTEHRLLSVLLTNPGKVMTHRHLMREVWGPAHVEQEHYVRIYIRRLRQKLERDPARPDHFLTETGIGYRFQP